MLYSPELFKISDQFLELELVHFTLLTVQFESGSELLIYRVLIFPSVINSKINSGSVSSMV